MTSRLATVAAAGLVVLAGCGGGVSTDDYADDLDEVCADIEKTTQEISQADVSGPAELSAQLDRIRAAIRDGIRRMRALDRPDGDDGQKAEEYVTKLQATLNEEMLPALDDLEAAVKAKSEVRIRAAAARLQAIDNAKTDRIAQDLGAEDCVS